MRHQRNREDGAAGRDEFMGTEPLAGTGGSPDGKRGTWGSLLSYTERVKWAILANAVLAFMTHGSILFSDRFGIDTDYMIEGVHNFDMIGRQGLVWSARLLGLGWFNLYLAQTLTLLFMALIPPVFSYLLATVCGQEKYLNITLLAFGASFTVSPLWATQIYFLNQSAQVTLGCILAAVSILLLEKARPLIRRKWFLIPSAIALMQVSFSCYQVIIVIYTAGTAACFLLFCMDGTRTTKQQIQWLIYHVVLFLAGFAVYLITSRLFFLNGGGYLENQIKWSGTGFTRGIKDCMKAIRYTLGKNPPFYTGLYGIFSLMLPAVTVLRMLGRKKIWGGSSILFILAQLFLIITPFLFILVYGGEIMDRMQLVMPLSQSCLIYTVILLAGCGGEEKGLPPFLVKGMGLILILMLYKNTMTQMSYSNRLYYTDEWRYQYDKSMAQKIYFDVKEAMEENGLENTGFDNILMVGYPSLPYNKMCVSGMVMGRSSFSYDIKTGGLNRERIGYCMKVNGFPIYSYFTEGEEAAFKAYYKDYFAEQIDQMPAYPDKGYIQYMSDDTIGLEYLVVKLGYDWDVWEETSE